MKGKLIEIGIIIGIFIVSFVLVGLLAGLAKLRSESLGVTVDKFRKKFIFAVVFGPVVEELIFRSPLFLAFSGLSKLAWIFIVISAIYFGVTHLPQLKDTHSFINRLNKSARKGAYVLRFVCVTAAGILFGWVTVRYQSLYLVIAAHGLTNLVMRLFQQIIQTIEHKPFGE